MVPRLAAVIAENPVNLHLLRTHPGRMASSKIRRAGKLFLEHRHMWPWRQSHENVIASVCPNGQMKADNLQSRRKGRKVRTVSWTPKGGGWTKSPSLTLMQVS